MSARDFNKKMHFEDFTKSVENIEKIIDHHLDWFTKQFQPTCDALVYPAYWVFSKKYTGGLIFEEKRLDEEGLPLYEKMARSEALSIKANLADHGCLQQQLIKQQIVDDYTSAGWYIYWGVDKNDKTREVLIINLVKTNE